MTTRDELPPGPSGRPSASGRDPRPAANTEAPGQRAAAPARPAHGSNGESLRAGASATILRPSRVPPEAPPPQVSSPGLDRPATASAGMAAEPGKGTILGDRYRLEELLGEGGMGVVFRASDLQMPGVQVAIKLLKTELHEQPELLNVLRESVRKVRSLPHPNIASVYSLDSDGGHDFVVMELLHGQTLHALLDIEYARGLPIAMARRLTSDLCSALAYAHDHGVIHSDIKPSNIFVTPSGHAKLFDFDIARVLRGPVGYFDANQVGAITHAYASEEMVRGERPDPRDDIYSLGCVIYEMLTGVHPFRGASAAEAREQHLQIKPLPSLRRRENQALALALKFEREERLGSVEALLRAFAERDGTSPTAVPRRPLVLGAAAAGLVVLLALAWWLLRPLASGLLPSVAAETAEAAAELDRAKTLAVRVAQVGVDEHDESLRRALGLLQAPREGESAPQTLQRARQASAAFAAVLARSPRTARLGTTAPQLEEAVRLCQQARTASLRCSAESLADEAPRTASLRPFSIDPTPVTNGDFSRFVQATGRRTAAETDGGIYSLDLAHGRAVLQRGQNWRTLRGDEAARGEAADSIPVLGVDLEAARAYCRWKGRRLPTEDEWEYSARGSSGRVFPWGDQLERTAPPPPRVMPVPDPGTGIASVSAFTGNVTEWTESRVAGQKVLRGGSWLLPQPYFQRFALRRLAPPGGSADAGFRCAASLERWPDTEEAEPPKAR